MCPHTPACALAESWLVSSTAPCQLRRGLHKHHHSPCVHHPVGLWASNTEQLHSSKHSCTDLWPVKDKGLQYPAPGLCSLPSPKCRLTAQVSGCAARQSVTSPSHRVLNLLLCGAVTAKEVCRKHCTYEQQFCNCRYVCRVMYVIYLNCLWNWP